MNLHHLKYFLVIVEEGSLTAASKKLLVGQPALSAQLKQFESWLGTALFERVGKKLVITPAGTYVLKYAKAIKDLENELISNLTHANEMISKELSIGVQESVPKSVLANAISSIRKIRPVHIKVKEGTGEELFNLLTANKIDVFIGNFRPLNSSKEVLYKSLGKEQVFVWGSSEMKRYKKNFPQSLEGLNFILSDYHNQLRHDFEKYMLQEGLSFNVPIEAQDSALHKEVASRSECLVLLGEESAKAWVNAGQLFKIGPLPIREEYWLGMVRKSLDNEYIKSILGGIEALS